MIKDCSLLASRGLPWQIYNKTKYIMLCHFEPIFCSFVMRHQSIFKTVFLIIRDRHNHIYDEETWNKFRWKILDGTLNIKDIAGSHIADRLKEMHARGNVSIVFRPYTAILNESRSFLSEFWRHCEKVSFRNICGSTLTFLLQSLWSLIECS